jgi:pimeloyl-ACP methyl ester carboxylesterase
MTSINRRTAALSLLTALAGACAGCAALPQDRLAPSGPSRGRVYLFRGLNGIFSTGLDAIGRRLAGEGFTVAVMQYDDWPQALAEIRGSSSRSPLVLVGHSWGADDAIRLAQALNAAPVEPIALLLTLDPVEPPTVPANVRAVVDFYQQNFLLDATPWFHGRPLAVDAPRMTKLENVNLRVDRPDLVTSDLTHGNMTLATPIIHAVIARIEQACARAR